MPVDADPYTPPESPPAGRSSMTGLRSASLSARFVAMIIDYVLSAAVFYGGAWVAYLFGVRGLGILVPTVFGLIKPICEACGGRTPGTALFGARVVGPNRRPIGPGAAIIRNLGWMLGPGIGSFLLMVLMAGGIPAGIGGVMLWTMALVGGLGWIVGCLMACGPSRRSLHDRIAGTVVVQGWTSAAITTTRRTRRRA